ncbi:HET-domain-containing protein [Melanomma pulvis-pyrius CBS 109.77]|uniref:HET-domain-containing protein n=1 Tax=Melanomma pulvis-pyrius CBS 109.77 TaxID=1314802 RepID=A0A6A6WS70_9PLEO|nr:HET-domain-containing protein [Melanomma pulvis-pyrius CBS 109.77]
MADSYSEDEDEYPYSWEPDFADEVSPDLCSTCQITIFKAPIWREMYMPPDELGERFPKYEGIHHHSYESFQSAVDQSCYICVELYNTLPVNFSEMTENIDSAKSEFTKWSISCPDGCGNESPDCGSFSVSLGNWTSDEQLQGLSIQFHLWRIHGKPTDIRSEALTLGSTNSTEAWNRANQWINECTAEHGCCAHLTSPGSVTWFPTRLIEIFGNDESETHIRLIETKETTPSGLYITLSHCWGNVNMMRLERSKIEEFKAGILNLPKTFNDLIIAARKFGIKYVWIDCLCIVQDEMSDWNIECSLMDKVYRNAFFNIAATASHNSHGGLFYDRLKSKPCTVILSAGKGREMFLLVDARQFEKDVANSPLLKRGWILQERLLAPRVLHFARRQLFWECKKLCASETYPYGLPSAVRRDDLQQGLEENRKNSVVKKAPLYLLKFPLCRSHEEVEGVEEIDQKEVKLWYQIVKTYSETSLTFSSDKLPALSGVAKFFQNGPRNTYLAGIWKAHLPHGLAWYRPYQTQETRLPRPEKYRAPTWSWMSMDSPITIASYSASPILRILDAQTSPCTVDPTGPVSGGFLVVEGPLIPLTWKGHWLYKNQETIYGTSSWLDEPRSDTQSDEEVEFFALPLLQYDYTVWQNLNWHHQYVPHTCIALLFLQPVQNHPGHFVRIGMGTAENTYGNDKLVMAKDLGDKLGVTYLGEERGYRLTIV